MSTRKLPEDERQFRLAQAKRRYDFLAGIEPAQRLTKRERKERQRQYELEAKTEGRPAPVVMVKKMLEHMRLINETGQEPVRGRFIVDLVASDMPLGSGARRWIADELARLYKLERVSPKAKQLNKLLAIRAFQLYFENYAGMTANDAEQAVAEAIGLDVGALRKRRQRARERKQSLR